MKLFNFDPMKILPRPTDAPGKRMGRPERYPWAKLEVGQGFEVSDPGAPAFDSMRVMCCTMGRKLGRTFRAQETSNNGIRTIYVGRYQGPSDIRIGEARPLPSAAPGRPLKLSFDIENYEEVDFPDAAYDGLKLNMLKPFQYFVWKDKGYDLAMIANQCNMHGGASTIQKKYVVEECLYKGKKEILVALTDKKY